MSRAGLERRLDRALAVVEREQERGSDQEALALIAASLIRSLSLIGDDGTLPDDYEERQAALDQEEERAYTPRQRKLLASFSRRYNVEGAKDELIRQLERNIKQEEEEGSRE